MMNIKVNPYSNNPYKYSNGNAPQNENNRQAFKGFSEELARRNLLKTGYGFLTDGLAYTLGFLTGQKPVQKVVKLIDKKFKPEDVTKHATAFLGLLLSGFYIHQTAKSKKIEEKQKFPLMLNQGIVALFSFATGYLLDNLMIEAYDKHVIDRFMKANGIQRFVDPKTKVLTDAAKHWDSGLKAARGIMVFSFMYRFVGPVIATPIANKLSTWWVNRKEQQAALAAQTQASSVNNTSQKAPAQTKAASQPIRK